MRFLRPLESFIGVFQGLFGMLLSGLVVFFPVVCGSGTARNVLTALGVSLVEPFH